MGIILGILKVILFIILGILGLILLLLLLILFCPLTYDVHGKGSKESYLLRVKLGWLFINPIIVLSKDEGMKFCIKIFGIPVKGGKSKAKKPEVKAVKSEAEKESVNDSNSEFKLEYLNDSDVSDDRVDELQAELEAEGLLEAPEAESEKQTINLEIANKDAASKEAADKETADKETADKETADKAAVNKDTVKKKNGKLQQIKEKIKAFSSKKALQKTNKKALTPEEREKLKKEKKIEKKKAREKKKEEILNKIKAIKDKIKFFKDTIQDEENKKAFRLVKDILVKTIKHIMPRKAKGHVEVGFVDPSQTGQLLAVCGMLYPVHKGNLSVNPYFDTDEMILKGNARIKGRLFGLFFLIQAIRVLTNKRLMSLIKKAMK